VAPGLRRGPGPRGWSFSAALLAASAAPLRGWRCPRPNGAQPGLSQHRTGIAHRLPPRRPLATRQERPAADDCNEPAGFGKDPTIVVRPPRTVLVGDSEAIAQYEALDELTSSQPPKTDHRPQGTGAHGHHGLRLHRSSPGGDLGGCLEDGPRDNHGHQRSTAVYPNSPHDQPRQCDQHRLATWSLDGMQGVRGSNPLSSTPHQRRSETMQLVRHGAFSSAPSSLGHTWGTCGSSYGVLGCWCGRPSHPRRRSSTSGCGSFSPA
jgi:hypothetical protein